MLAINKPDEPIEVDKPAVFAPPFIKPPYKCRECPECGDTFEHSFSKYCGDVCRKVSRKRAQIKNKDLNRAKYESLTKEEKCVIVYQKYKEGAVKRGLEFTLDEGLFEKYCGDTCHYCGDTLKAVGFDRVDSAIGYVETNVVPCCTTCNMMKRVMSVETFLNHCHKIINHSHKG